MQVNATGATTLVTPAASAGAWQQGQVLVATVLKAESAQLLLKIGQQLIRARQAPGAAQASGQAPLQAGQQVQLRVHSLGAGTVTLSVLTEPARNVANEALLRHLPRQDSLAPLLANLALLARPQTPTTVPEPVAALARVLFQALPRADQAATAGGMRQALWNSGLFLEHKLFAAALAGRTAAIAGGDFKGALLRLLALLQGQLARHGASARQAPATPTTPAPPREQQGGGAPSGPAPGVRAAAPTGASVPPPLPQQPVRAHPPAAPSLTAGTPPPAALAELARQVEAAVSRIQLHQLASVAQEGGERPLLSIDLPLRHGEGITLFSLQVGRDGGGGEEEPGEGAVWRLHLAFELSGLGPLQVSICLAKGQVTVDFWAERPATRATLAERLALLRDGLQQAGLSVASVACHAGRPPPEPGAPAPRLLSERA